MIAPLVLAAMAASPAPAVAPPARATPAALRYPVARRGDTVDDYFGVKVPDPYRWLEDDDAEETRAWVKAENAVTEAFLEAIPERPAIRRRLERLWDHERFSSPEKKGGRYFYLRNSGLQPQEVLYVTEDPARGGRVLLDPNLLSSDGTVALSSWAVTDDGRLLAYALSTAGSDWLTWRVRDVASGADLPDLVRWSKASGASWRKDGSGFYYSRYREPRAGEELKAVNQTHQVFFHRVGTPQSRDRLVFQRADQPEWYLGAQVTDDDRYLVISAWKGTNPETAVFVQDLRRRGVVPEPFLDRMDAAYDVVDNRGDVFFVRTDKDAPRERLVAIRLGHPDPRDWREIIPQAPGRDVLEQVTLVGGRVFALWMRDVKSAVEVYDLDGRKTGEVALPGLGTATGFRGRRRDGETFYAFTSFTAPPAIYRLDVKALASTVFRRPAVDFDPGAFETEQVFFPSRKRGPRRKARPRVGSPRRRGLGRRRRWRRRSPAPCPGLALESGLHELRHLRAVARVRPAAEGRAPDDGSAPRVPEHHFQQHLVGVEEAAVLHRERRRGRRGEVRLVRLGPGPDVDPEVEVLRRRRFRDGDGPRQDGSGGRSRRRRVRARGRARRRGGRGRMGRRHRHGDAGGLRSGSSRGSGSAGSRGRDRRSGGGRMAAGLDGGRSATALAPALAPARSEGDHHHRHDDRDAHHHAGGGGRLAALPPRGPGHRPLAQEEHRVGLRGGHAAPLERRVEGCLARRPGAFRLRRIHAARPLHPQLHVRLCEVHSLDRRRRRWRGQGLPGGGAPKGGDGRHGDAAETAPACRRELAHATSHRDGTSSAGAWRSRPGGVRPSGQRFDSGAQI